MPLRELDLPSPPTSPAAVSIPFATLPRMIKPEYGPSPVAALWQHWNRAHPEISGKQFRHEYLNERWNEPQSQIPRGPWRSLTEYVDDLLKLAHLARQLPHASDGIQVLDWVLEQTMTINKGNRPTYEIPQRLLQLLEGY